MSCRSRAVAAGWIAAALAVTVVGCGSEPSPADPTETSQAPGTSEHGSLAHCLHEHGIDESAVSPAGPPPGVDPGTWDKAMQACSPLGPGPAAP
ncbi:hypothetical protein A5727_13980 [Mycobacterium sp. ACS4331]|nr:hypothetical protein A5727_13980 [Mycobacterium sp. ACS4331]